MGLMADTEPEIEPTPEPAPQRNGPSRAHAVLDLLRARQRQRAAAVTDGLSEPERRAPTGGEGIEGGDP